MKSGTQITSAKDFWYSLRDFQRSMPEWFGTAVYGTAVFTVIAAALAMLATIGGAPAPHSVTAQSEKKQAAARAPVDTPETAPELSPVYPTLVYGNTTSTGQAELARRRAREGKVTLRTPGAERPQEETDGSAPREFFSAPSRRYNSGESRDYYWGGGPKR